MPYTYVFAIGTCFAMLDAYNNGANDVANAWATSVSSRSISYRQAMVFGTIFELLGAITVGARTADTIKNGIIPVAAFNGNAGVQMLAFTCALAAASSWVMWCTKHSAHVSSTYSLISAVAGVGVAVAGADKVQWGWNNGKGLGAIFAGLGMAPAISACFGAIIFMLIKVVVHLRKNPVPWAVWTAPFWFLIAGTICTLSIVYKGSPNLGLNKKPGSFIAGVTMGTGGGVALLAALFFVPFLHARIVKKDAGVKWYMFIQGPLLFRRPAPQDNERSVVPNYAVVQHDEDEFTTDSRSSETDVPISKQVVENEKAFDHIAQQEINGKVLSNKELNELSEKRLNEKLMKGKGPLAWALRTLRDNPMGAGQVYELHNMKIVAKRIPAYIVCGALYGLHYDIHAAQSGTAGTPEGARMARVYAHAEKYSNEVEHSYSFVQVLTACTASFAHGANDIGNSVGPWAVIYSAWSTGNAAAAKAPVPVWQLAVLALMISIGLVTYGYNIMKGKLLLSTSPQAIFTNILHSHGQQDHLSLALPRLQHGNGRRHHRPRLLAILPPSLDLHVHHRRHRRRWSLQWNPQSRQLAAYRTVALCMDHDHPDRWLTWRHNDGAFPQRAAFCIRGIPKFSEDEC